MVDPKKLKVTELRDELEKRGESTSGLKAALVERLTEVLAAEASSGAAPAATIASDDDAEEEEEEEEEKSEEEEEQEEQEAAVAADADVAAPSGAEEEQMDVPEAVTAAALTVNEDAGAAEEDMQGVTAAKEEKEGEEAAASSVAPWGIASDNEKEEEEEEEEGPPLPKRVKAEDDAAGASEQAPPNAASADAAPSNAPVPSISSSSSSVTSSSSSSSSAAAAAAAAASNGIPTSAVKLRGLPYDCNAAQVVAFLSEALEGRKPLEVVLVNNQSGDALVALPEPGDAVNCVSKCNRRSIGKRYVEVLRVFDPRDVGRAREAVERAGQTDADYRGVVKVRGLPYSATARSLIAWFQNPPAGVAVAAAATAAASEKEEDEEEEEAAAEAENGEKGGADGGGSGGGSSSGKKRKRSGGGGGGSSDGIPRISKDGVHLITTRQGKPSGDAFVVMESEGDADLACARNRQEMGGRWLEISKVNKGEMYASVNAGMSNMESGGLGGPNAVGGPSPSMTVVGGGSGSGGGHRHPPQFVDPLEVLMPDGATLLSREEAAAAGEGDRPSTGVLRMRGLPFAVTKQQILAFLAAAPSSSSSSSSSGDGYIPLDENDEATESVSEERVFMGYDANGRATGEAFVLLSSEAAARALAHRRDKDQLSGRWVDLFVASRAEMYDRLGVGISVVSASGSHPFTALSSGKNATGTAATARVACLLRGLPFKVQVADVLRFFNGYAVAPHGVWILTGQQDPRPTGDAFVQFADERHAAAAAQACHGQSMALGGGSAAMLQAQQVSGSAARAVEVFLCPLSDLVTATARCGRGAPPTPYQNNLLLPVYNRTPHTCVRVAGLPFGACDDDAVKRFFDGLQLASVHVCRDLRAQGRPTGEAFVEFAGPVECQRATAFNRETVEERYVEVFAISREESQRAVAHNSQMPQPQHYPPPHHHHGSSYQHGGGGAGGGGGRGPPPQGYGHHPPPQHGGQHHYPPHPHGGHGGGQHHYPPPHHQQQHYPQQHYQGGGGGGGGGGAPRGYPPQQMHHQQHHQQHRGPGGYPPQQMHHHQMMQHRHQQQQYARPPPHHGGPPRGYPPPQQQQPYRQPPPQQPQQQQPATSAVAQQAQAQYDQQLAQYEAQLIAQGYKPEDARRASQTASATYAAQLAAQQQQQPGYRR